MFQKYSYKMHLKCVKASNICETLEEIKNTLTNKLITD